MVRTRASQRLASIAELTRETRIPDTAVSQRMKQPGAPPQARVSNGKNPVCWAEDGVAYLTYGCEWRGRGGHAVAGYRDKGGHWHAWRPAPEGVVGVSDIARAAGRTRSAIWLKLQHPDAPPYQKLACGPVWQSLDDALQFVLTPLPPGRRADPGPGPTLLAVDAGDGWERVAWPDGQADHWRKRLPDGTWLVLTRGERPGGRASRQAGPMRGGTSWNWEHRSALPDQPGEQYACGPSGSVRGARRLADEYAARLGQGATAAVS